jgi:hypothetical protein
MAPVWDLFINSGEMDQILGLSVKVQVILPPGERNPNSIMKQFWYYKHHVNYSSKVSYSQHKTIVNLDHPVTLAMIDDSHPPRCVSTLCHKYFDLKTSDNGNIIHGVFLCIKFATHGSSVDILHIWRQTRRQNLFLPKLLTAHWLCGIGTGWKKGYTQGTIASLLNSFESDAADNAQDSLYNPQSMSMTSMFAGDDKNQWLD